MQVNNINNTESEENQMNEEQEKVRKRLIYLIENRGLKQVYFADRIYLKSSIISHFIKGKCNLSEERLSKLSDVLTEFDSL